MLTRVEEVRHPLLHPPVRWLRLILRHCQILRPMFRNLTRVEEVRHPLLHLHPRNPMVAVVK